MLREVPPCPQCHARPWSAELTGVRTPLTGVRTCLDSWARHLFQERRLNFTKNFSSPIDRTQDFPLKSVEMGGYVGCFLNIEPLFYLWDEPNVVTLCCPFSAPRAPGVSFRGRHFPSCSIVFSRSYSLPRVSQRGFFLCCVLEELRVD